MAQITEGLRSIGQYLDDTEPTKRKSDDSRLPDSSASPSKKQKREASEGDRQKQSSERERRKEKKSKRSKDHDRSSKKQSKNSVKQEAIPEEFYNEIGKHFMNCCTGPISSIGRAKPVGTHTP